ncbi:hypothetical protein [Saccharopolyspora sp. NPDC002376]
MAKSRHRKAENLRRYFKPSPQAMRELTNLIGPGAPAPTNQRLRHIRPKFGRYYGDPNAER